MVGCNLDVFSTQVLISVSLSIQFFAPAGLDKFIYLFFYFKLHIYFEREMLLLAHATLSLQFIVWIEQQTTWKKL